MAKKKVKKKRSVSKSDEKAKELWVRFAQAAVANYPMTGKKDARELGEDMADIACEFADNMLEELEYRFDGGPLPERHQEEEEDEEEEEEEDEDSDDDEDEDDE